MGVKITKCSFVPKPNEQIDTVITIDEEQRSVIHGVVKDKCGNYVKDAVVKLFKAKSDTDKCELKPITHVFTDECGQFLFGPLKPCIKYVIKVWVNNVKVKKVECDNCNECDSQKYTDEEDVKNCIEIDDNCNYKCSYDKY